MLRGDRLPSRSAVRFYPADFRLYRCALSPSAVAVATEPAPSADYIAALPEGEIRRQVVLGCTPCHQISTLAAHKRTIEEWRAVIARQRQIDDHLDLALIQLEAEPLAQWLTANARLPKQGYAIPTAPADIREYPAGPKERFLLRHGAGGGQGLARGLTPATSSMASTSKPVRSKHTTCR